MIILTPEKLHELIVKAIETGVDMNDDQLANGMADIIIGDEELDTPIWSKTYDGFESLADIGRDVDEAFDPRFNEGADKLPPQFDGKLKVAIVYEPVEEIEEDDREV